MTDDLQDFVRDATDRMGFGDQIEPDEPDLEDELELDEEGDEADDDEASEPAEPIGVDELTDDEYQTLGNEFWTSLSASQRLAAEASEDQQAKLWGTFLADRGVELGEGAADEAGEGPQTASELVEAVLSGGYDLVDEGGNRLTPGEYLDALASVPEQTWLKMAREAGWDPNERPSYSLISQFGKTVQGAVTRASWSRTLDTLKADNEKRAREGRPPRYLGQ